MGEGQARLGHLLGHRSIRRKRVRRRGALLDQRDQFHACKETQGLGIESAILLLVVEAPEIAIILKLETQVLRPRLSLLGQPSVHRSERRALLHHVRRQQALRGLTMALLVLLLQVGTAVAASVSAALWVRSARSSVPSSSPGPGIIIGDEGMVMSAENARGELVDVRLTADEQNRWNARAAYWAAAAAGLGAFAFGLEWVLANLL